MASSPPITHGLEVSGHDLLDQIGNTPLVYLRSISAETPGVQIFVKDESRNPGGSVKDRPAMNMVLDGERRGVLTRDKILLDATSGNTGFAYAMIGAARGYRVRLCLPANASPGAEAHSEGIRR
jgi:cysteine synthase B